MVTQKGWYGAVYLTEGREWINVSRLGPDQMSVRQDSEDFARRIPEWARENVLQRIVKVEIREVES